ncbi:MAG: hypothetical protein ACO4CT_02890 [Planctomycetota bacterium]
MNGAAALFLVAGFLAVAHVLRMVPRAREVMARSRDAVRDLRDPGLDDLAREKAVQGHALRLAWLFVLLVLISATALGVPLAVVFGLDRLGVVELQAVLDVTLTPIFLIGVTAAVLGWTFVRRPRRVEG